jgi:hypothetical protein
LKLIMLRFIVAEFGYDFLSYSNYKENYLNPWD